MQLVLIEKHAHRKGNIRYVRNWSQAISSNCSCLFRSKIAKIAKGKCSHFVMDLNDCFRWLFMAPLHRIIALWVHPLRHRPCFQSLYGYQCMAKVTQGTGKGVKYWVWPEYLHLDKHPVRDYERGGGHKRL